MSSDIGKINRIFRKIAWFDENRWDQDLNGKLLINFSHDLKNSEKILTHFLCYISNRQMPFSKIWDIGGFVYSDIVHKYKNTDIDIKDLLKPDSSLDPKRPDSIESSKSFFREENTSKSKKYTFISKSRIPKNNLLIKNYGLRENEYAIFTPRFCTSDLKSIMQTLLILEDEKFKKNIIKFIEYIMKKNLHDEHDDLLIKKIAFSFYLLAYYNDTGNKQKETQIKQEETQNDKQKGIQFNSIKKDAEDNKRMVTKILNNREIFEKEFKKFEKDISNKKRVWCTLRDYVKLEEFKDYIAGGFEEIGKKDLIPKWKELNEKELELPGDVWNNNVKFRNCLFGGLDWVKEDKVKNNKKLNLSSSSFNSSHFIRELYEDFKKKEDFKKNEEFKKNIDYCYPEMFDVTFDFAPRMCEREMCDFCIFNENNKIEDICVKDESKFCPIMMVSCGYINKCNPKKCEICQK